MEHSFIDEHSQIDSFLSRLDPRAKMVSFLALLLCLLSTNPLTLSQFTFYLVLLGVITGVSRISPLIILKKSGVVLPFVFMMAVFIPFLKGGQAVVTVVAGPLHLVITQEGLQLFASVLAKSWLSCLGMVLLMVSTRFTDLLKALEKLKCPQLIILILSFMYRFIFVIQDELMKMKRAKASRGVGGPRRLHWRAMANVVGVLFVRSFERAESVYLAMCARGFAGQIHPYHHFKLKKADWVFTVAMGISLAGIKLAGIKLAGV